MLDFKKIKLEDKDWIQPLLDYSGFRSQEYSFNFTYLWRDVFAYSAVRINDYVVIKSSREDHPPSYLFPAGKGDLRPVIEALYKDAEENGSNLVFHAILEEGKAALEELYPDKFEYITLTDYFDYVYESERMISLSGKKLSSKRNHINRFKENHPDWSYEPITKDNIAEVVEMNRKWVEIEKEDDNTKSFEQESESVDKAIDHYFELSLKGGLLRAGGEVVAFTMGDRLTDDTMLIHIEKAYKSVQGAYPMINQQFAMHEGKNYTYVNREDDSGHEGLRRAKQSYQPVFMVEKFGGKLKDNGNVLL